MPNRGDRGCMREKWQAGEGYFRIACNNSMLVVIYARMPRKFCPMDLGTAASRRSWFVRHDDGLDCSGAEVARDGAERSRLHAPVDRCASIPTVGKNPGCEFKSLRQQNRGQDERPLNRRRLALRGLLCLQIAKDEKAGSPWLEGTPLCFHSSNNESLDSCLTRITEERRVPPHGPRTVPLSRRFEPTLEYSTSSLPLRRSSRSRCCRPPHRTTS